MASPILTEATLGNVANGVTVAGAGGSVTYYLYPGATGAGNVASPTNTVFETQLFVSATVGATPSTANGFTVNCYAGAGNGLPPAWETRPSLPYTSENVAANGTASRKLFLAGPVPGWKIVVTNNDATAGNSFALTITDDTYSGIA